MNKNCLTDVRNTLMILLAFIAFLRVDELLHIQLEHIKMHKTHIEIYIPKAKTDQLRQGNSVVVSKTGGPGCPLSMLQLYLWLSKIELHKNVKHFLFARCIFKKKVLQLFNPCVAMSYGNFRDIVKSVSHQVRPKNICNSFYEG
jgi:integrase